jgi:hypothetical protein
MPTGFFLSSMGAGRTGPNGLVAVLWLGAASLTVGVVVLGLALLRGAFRAEARSGAASGPGADS